MNKVVIFDLEATCDTDNSNFLQEIIEIGAVDNLGNEFQAFIRPQVNTQLTDFCKDLTSITQKDVDNAKIFAEVLPDFLEFIKDAVIMSWGAFDLKQLLQDLQTNNITGYDEYITDCHINMKDYYKEVMGTKARGTQHALRKFGLTFEGTAHRGIDDARNLYKVYCKLSKLREEAIREKNRNNLENLLIEIQDFTPNRFDPYDDSCGYDLDGTMDDISELAEKALAILKTGNY